jgi:hypothetical protein
MRRILASVCVGLLLAGFAAAQTARPAPAQGVPDKSVVMAMQGKIVRVDPQKGVVVIRTGVGATARDMEYRVGRTTRYFGTDRAALKEGLKHEGFKEGADVWYRPLPTKTGAPAENTAGSSPRNISEIGFGRTAPAPKTGSPGKAP